MPGEGKKNKLRGYRLEKLITDRAQELGLEARRAWGSNGKAIGLPATVDVEVQGRYAQCKKRKKLAAFLYPDEGCDVQIVQADRKEPLVILPFSQWLNLLKTAQAYEQTNDS